MVRIDACRPIPPRATARSACRRATATAVAALVMLAACSDGGPSGVDPQVPDPTPYTTGAALANLRGGQFQLPDPVPGAVPEIGRARAESLALAWRGDFGPFETNLLSEQHGAPVDPVTTVLCRRTQYVRSAYLPPTPAVVADPLPMASSRGFGPQWLVSLCNPAGELVITLAVAAYSTDLELRTGHIRTPPMGGNWFFALGVPVGVGRVPLSPEAAAVDAAIATGRLVSEVPTLVGSAPFVGAPQFAHWQIKLNAPASVWRAGDTTSTPVTELYVRLEFYAPAVRRHIAARVMPPYDSLLYNADTVRGQPPDYRPVYVFRDPAFPTRFDAVTTSTTPPGP